MKSKLRILLGLLCLTVAGFAAVPLHAAEWVSPIGGDFDSPANWQGGIVPTAGIDAFFLIPDAYEVNFNFNEGSSNLLVTAGQVTFNLQDNSYSLSGNATIADSTLTLNGGQVNLGGGMTTSVLSVVNGGTLSGSATTLSSTGPGIHFVVDVGGTLRGDLTFQGFLLSNGLVAPGTAGPGTIAVDMSDFNPGNFLLDTQGTLQIEVGGTSPGTQHDLLVTSGVATLSGRLEVPFINGYTPVIGHNINFLQSAGPANLQWKSLAFPNLNTTTVAVEVFPTPLGATIGFVAPTQIAFDPMAPPPPNLWDDAATWGGQVPTSSSIVTAANTALFARRIDFVPGDSRFVHELALSGTTSSMTLHVPEETNFTAIHKIDVGQNGILELEGGNVHSNQVNINAGGTLRGNGKILGDLVVGADQGTAPAVISPGFSPGVIQVNGDLTIQENGLVEIEIESTSSFDKVTVSQTADLGGTLEIDITGVNIASIQNSSFAVLTASNVDDRFASVMTVGAPDYFFAPDYGEFAVLMSLFEEGDMERDFDLDAADVIAFAKAIKDPDGYFDDRGISGDASGDINDDGVLDFDDIAPFAAIHGIGLTAEEVAAIIANYQAVPEPTSLVVLSLTLALMSTSRMTCGGRF